MPTGIVIQLIERVAKLEAKAESLLIYQKWQMGILGAVLASIVMLGVSILVRVR